MESTEIDKLCLASSSATGLLLFAGTQASGGGHRLLPITTDDDVVDDDYQPLGGRILASKRGAAGPAESDEINPTESASRWRRTPGGAGPGSRWGLGGHQRRRLIFTDDSTSFADYTPTTVDPGNTLTILAAFILIGSLLLLPVFVKFGRYVLRYRESDRPPRCCNPFIRVVKFRRRYHGRAGRDVEALEHRRRVMSRARRREARESVRRHHLEHVPQSVSLDSPKSAEDDGGGGNDRWEEDGGANDGTGGVKSYLQESPASGPNENGGGSGLAALEMVRVGTGVDVEGKPDETRLARRNRNSQNNDDDNERASAIFGADPATNAPVSDPTSKLTARGYIRRRLKFLWSIVRYDYEMNRLLNLAVPFTAYALIEGVCDILGLIIVSHRLGTDSLIALAMVDIFLGTTAEFVGGWVEASSSLVSMAYGAGNYRRAGQYLQVSVIGYVLGQIPMAILWGFATKPLIIFLGLGETAGDIAQGECVAFLLPTAF